MAEYKTDQEHFWAGDFGDAYIDRNPNNFELASRLSLFAKILNRTRNVQSVIEFGANIGNNLKVLAQLLPGVDLNAVEINAKAVEALRDWGGAKVHHQSILDFSMDSPCDLSFMSGVLIHINPDILPEVYERLYQASCRYVCVVEYYNPSPVEISYRGHDGKLFKRDFTGELLQRYTDLQLLDYGFVYHGDNNYPLDDLTWFLLEKK